MRIVISALIFATTFRNGKLVHAQRCVPPPSSLIGWWPGDGNSADIIGGNDGDPNGGVTYEGDVFNLEGPENSVVVPYNPKFNFGENHKFTLMTWVYFNSFHAHNALVVKGEDFDWDYGLYYIGNTFCAGGQHCDAPFHVPMDTNKWHHVALTWDEKWRIYVDGVFRGESLTCPPVKGKDHSIGFGEKGGHPADRLDGKLDEVAIFNAALDESEISSIYKNGMCKEQCVPPPESLIGMWPGDGDVADVIGDNDGEPVGDVTYAGDVFNLLGADNAVLVPYNPIFDFDSTQRFTLMTWVYFNSFKDHNAIIVKGVNFDWDYGLWYIGDTFCAGGEHCDAALGVDASVRRWYHVALVWDGMWALYVDGVYRGESSECPPVKGEDHPIGLGEKGGFSSDRLDGKLDEVAIFNTALREHEIRKIYQSGLCKERAATPPESLVSLWPGDGNAKDIAGCNDGEVVGDVAYDGDVFNLNGPDNGVMIPYNPLFNFGSKHKFTLMTWVYFNSFSTHNAIIVKGVDFDWDYGLWYIGDSFCTGGHHCDSRLDVSISLRRWYHVALTWDNKWKIYLNGVYRESSSDCPPVKGKNHPIGFGEKGKHSSDWLDGKLDEVAIFNRALDEREIFNIYQNGLQKDILIDDEGPVVSELVASPTEVCDETTVTATVDDTNTGNSYIEKATCTLGDGNPPGDSITVELLPRNDATEVITFQHTFTQVGLYRTCVFGADIKDNAGPEECTFLPVYDPKGGYAKANGWFNSPEGAVTGDEDCIKPYQSDKVIFSVDCEYKNGVPTGSTEFNYVAGGLYFSSDSYDWLVVDKPRAIYQGVGKINGNGGYGFLVSMVDGGRLGKDKIRIKIWDKSDGTVVYDNEPGKDDDAVPSTKKGGGSLGVYNSKSPTVCESGRRAAETVAKAANSTGHNLRA